MHRASFFVYSWLVLIASSPFISTPHQSPRCQTRLVRIHVTIQRQQHIANHRTGRWPLQPRLRRACRRAAGISLPLPGRGAVLSCVPAAQEPNVRRG